MFKIIFTLVCSMLALASFNARANHSIKAVLPTGSNALIVEDKKTQERGIIKSVTVPSAQFFDTKLFRDAMNVKCFNWDRDSDPSAGC